MEEVWKDISLSLSSIHNHHHHPSTAVDHHSLNFQDFLSNDRGLFSSEAPATVLSLGTCGAPTKKRALFVDGPNEEERSKRLMKNRESADRSRARKQAYTVELEKEVERLKKENAQLRGQLKMFNSEGNAHIPKKHSLHRTLTAPF